MPDGFTLENLNFSYADKEVLRNITLSIPRGEFVCLLGASGSGKTTLLNILAGLQRPSSGSVRWGEGEILAPSPERAVVFQEYSLFPWLTLCSNVALAIRKTHAKLSRREARQLALEYIEMVGLESAAAKYPFELSGGMRQRGAIARALATGAEVLLMDEPFGALDPVNRLKLQNLLLEVCGGAKKITVVFVTHDIGEALYLGHRVVVLGANPGRIIADIPVAHQSSHADRAEWFKDPAVVRQSGEIEAIVRQDILSQIEAEFNEGAGI